MGNTGVVRIRVEALGVSITIADGNIAIKQTGFPAAGVTPKVERSTAAGHQASGSPVQASPASTAIPASGHQSLPKVHKSPARAPERVPLSKRVDKAGTAVPDSQEIPVRAKSPTARGNAGGSVIDELEQAPDRSLSPNGLAGRPTACKPQAQDQESGQPWSNEEVERLRALYPTHSAGAIAVELGRGLNSVRAKAQHLGLRKDGPPTVTVKPAPPAPRSLSAAVTIDRTPGPLPFVPELFAGVPLLDHRPGQYRWIVSDVWPAIYCGAPVVDSSSWCEQHSRRVFNLRPQGLGVFRSKAWP